MALYGLNVCFQIHSFLSLDNDCLTDSPVIHWRLDAINGSPIEPFTDFIQPNNSVLSLEPYSLQPGFYIVSLELTFKHYSVNAWNTDFILVSVLLPELVATIAGGSHITALHGTTFIVDASRSNDPVSSLVPVNEDPLVANWSFVLYYGAPTTLAKNLFMKRFPDYPLPAGSMGYIVEEGDEYLLAINTSYFPAGTQAVVMFSLSRSNRTSSTFQWIDIKQNIIPVTLR